ncbi:MULTISPECIES: GNAT family N-acetyltransferase [unclassified Modestobacter]|uniref:GNAT family N-acetyltransferase n=1 Tax=unclassified Modestobacter TaxID=2643866 RepID=UPI0022AB2F99|nr:MULTISPECIES: GNAT family N-acetyltransferase [unclassified Modestobacter]MCZ2823923.1 GNAT family N-acetyltransferase [Modestobacter sp. VKM Ac-2981]MCZ2852168.1 GNAT family N-acetyltransferase [Modestobacter sp. VKM Ac-2982]
MSVRRARPDDVPTVLRLVRELAAYEESEHEAQMTADQLHAALFGESPALFGHVALAGDGEIAGFALWFLNFSTWRGTHGLYLEDLYVSPAHRGTGLGRELLRTLADECVARGFARLEWSVLDWNTPSIEFYRAAGAVPMDGWTVFRLTGDALPRFAADRR